MEISYIPNIYEGGVDLWTTWHRASQQVANQMNGMRIIRTQNRTHNGNRIDYRQLRPALFFNKLPGGSLSERLRFLIRGDFAGSHSPILFCKRSSAGRMPIYDGSKGGCQHYPPYLALTGCPEDPQHSFARGNDHFVFMFIGI